MTSPDATVEDPGAGLEAIRRRITRLTLAAGLPRDVWSELCHLDTALSQLLAAPLSTAFDRADVAITGRGAADLTEQLQPGYTMSPADTAIIDQALNVYASSVTGAPIDDIARIRAELTGAPPTWTVLS